ncbi:MAG: hypothetical protein M3N13_01905 [Candidatus Eremiobacteraeota bacterium]|nr:hypothetical protein [Candidatus Eremiobacteraeota bacterium]
MLTEAFSRTGPPGPATAPYSVTNTLNVRGELIDRLGSGEERTRTNSGCLQPMSFPDTIAAYDSTSDPSLVPTNCDRVNGVDLSPNSSVANELYNGNLYPTGSANSVGFDLTGRMSRTVSRFYGFNQYSGAGDIPGPLPDQGDSAFAYRPGPSGARAMSEKNIIDRSYDVENHLRTLQYTMARSSANAGQGQALPPPAGTPGALLTIGWGPNGHPIRLPAYSNPLGSAGYMTLHWDGDTILFVTDDFGNVIDFKAGIDGDVTPRDPVFAGLTVYDRDAAGVIVQASNPQRNSGFTPLDPSPATGNYFGGATVQAQYVRSDGFMIANGIQINGVRAFDANVAAWTTPDAYEGNAHDPASQQKYMWNRGNAVDYRDPSGFKIEFVGDVFDQLQGGILFDEAIDYLTSKGDSGGANFLKNIRDNPSFTINASVTLGGGDNSVDQFNGTLHWDATAGTVPDGGSRRSVQSPALGLLHEASHALRFVTDRVGLYKDLNTSNAKYGNEEERRVIEGMESENARSLGQPVRDSHAGTHCRVTAVSGTSCV